jgi:hypothetical protein
MMVEPAPYVLTHEFTHLGDDSADAHVVEVPGYDDGAWLTDQPTIVPERLAFDANFGSLARTDFPMSLRMIEILRAVGPMPAHVVVPVVMHDDTRRTPEPDLRFGCLLLREFSDAFDWERSTYTPHRRLPRRVLTIQDLVLREPPGGFPAVFRLAAAPTSILVSAAARRALDDAGVQRVRLISHKAIVF